MTIFELSARVAVSVVVALVHINHAGAQAGEVARKTEHNRTRANVHFAEPGQSQWDCDKRQPWCLEMVVVPAGSFLMGSPGDETDRERDEGPQRLVSFPRSFLVSKFEVTFDAWDACVADRVCSNRPNDEGWGRGRRPVINVSWHDTQVFVSWLSKRTWRPYRLLTEAEWEYTARAGTTTAFSTGKTITTDRANFSGNGVYDSNSTGQHRSRTMEVGSFPANLWGLHDMHGNVGEWVEGCYAETYTAAPFVGVTALDEAPCRSIVRGGSWADPPQRQRSAYRTWYDTNFSEDVVGFRVARTLQASHP